jgi:hypothetical protein
MRNCDKVGRISQEMNLSASAFSPRVESPFDIADPQQGQNASRTQEKICTKLEAKKNFTNSFCAA